jgi:hypothetical protein
MYTYETTPKPVSAFRWSGSPRDVMDFIEWVRRHDTDQYAVFIHKQTSHTTWDLCISVAKKLVQKEELLRKSIVHPDGGLIYNEEYTRFETFTPEEFNERFREVTLISGQIDPELECQYTK